MRQTSGLGTLPGTSRSKVCLWHSWPGQLGIPTDPHGKLRRPLEQLHDCAAGSTLRTAASLHSSLP